MIQAPYGTWRSPISARDVAEGGVRLGGVGFGSDDSLWWVESRPAEGGRSVVVSSMPGGGHFDVLPEGWNARTRVHEYGGGAWLALEGGSLVFANWEDQRLYLLDPDADGGPVALTPEPPSPQAHRYADLVESPGGAEVICVREREVQGANAVTRDLVAVALDGSQVVRTVVVDGHFLSNPRTSPDGRHLSWLTWDHPRMPWDGTELRIADLDADGKVGDPWTLLGGPGESVFQPEWAGPDALYAVSDRSGWWNVYEVGVSGDVLALCQRDEEFGHPAWVFGMARYGILDDGRLAVTHGKGTWTLSVLDPATGDLTDVAGAAVGGPGTSLTYFDPSMSVRGQTVATIAGGPSTPLSIVTVDVSSGLVEIVKSSIDESPPSEYLPSLAFATFEGNRGRDVHGFVYAPRSPDFSAPLGELPPYVAFVHGGPTAQSAPVMDMTIAFFTSRGIGVVVVDYGGSSGYGREYRNRLRGSWGVVDVEDVESAVKGLADNGEADSRRLLVRGGSAGGWTVLAALTRTDGFAAGASYYGVADLMGLVQDTHDFESRYIDGLVGPLPEARDLYVERSPLSHVDELNCPILLLQGAEDKIVLPNQAEMFRDAMRGKGIPHAYLLFEGEQHGFRRAETIERALEAELSFYGQVLGFEPPGVPVLELESGSR